MTAFELRPMRWQDITTLVALESELFADDAWAAPAWWAELAGRPRRDYVVAADPTDHILGYAGLDLGGEVADVMTLAVGAGAQGQGIGRVLLEHLVDRAAGGGAAYLMLEVRDDNEPAKNLYQTRGFEVLTTRRRYYQPGDVDALVMRLRLEVAA